MEPFIRLQAVAAPVPIANIDTDMLVPARFLKTVSKKGLARALFASQRFDADGGERADFVLNRDPWRRAGILVTLDNFGCGSSREHAPWALIDYGIRCVIAPSFADIFRANCFKNGILPITFDAATVQRLILLVGNAATAELSVDLVEQTIAMAEGEAIRFDLGATERDRLLSGADDISITLQRDADIADHEDERLAATPWFGPIPMSDILAAG